MPINYFRGKNTNTIMKKVYNSVNEECVEDKSRNGDVLRFQGLSVMEYTRPWETVNFHTTRDMNPFFTVMEIAWMLAGRRDVKFLNYFNSNMKNYSDDGETFNAAYGYRLRFHFGFDQLESVIKILRKDPTTRQAVCQIWCPRDLVTDTKDKACLYTDSRFMSPEKQYSVKKLTWLFEKGKLTKYPVYGMDVETGEVKITWLTNCWYVGKKKTMKVTCSNGEVVRATNDHRLWIRDSKNKQAIETTLGELEIGDTLMAVKYRSCDVHHMFEDKSNEEISTSYGMDSYPVVTHIEYLGEEDVYDFTVPETHNAALDNGIFVHNCNMQLVFSLQPYTRKLDMIIYNRSNDAVWGAVSGTNPAHFGAIHQYVANGAILEQGNMYQVSANLHLYTDNPKTKLLIDNPINKKDFCNGYDLNDLDFAVTTYKYANMLDDLRIFFGWFDNDPQLIVNYAEKWVIGNEGLCLENMFVNQLCILFAAYHAYKNKEYSKAIDWCDEVRTDWSLRCVAWLAQRELNRSKK